MLLRANKNIRKNFLFVAVILMATGLSACFPKIVEEKQKKNIRENAVNVLGDKTNCEFNGPPGNGSKDPLEGTWESLDWQQNETLRFTYTLKFTRISESKHSIEFTNYCTHKQSNRYAAATVMTTVIDQTRSFEVEKSLYDDHTEKFPEFEITCDAESKAGRFQYNFDRDCLVIDGGYYIKRK